MLLSLVRDLVVPLCLTVHPFCPTVRPSVRPPLVHLTKSQSVGAIFTRQLLLLSATAAAFIRHLVACNFSGKLLKRP